MLSKNKEWGYLCNLLRKGVPHPIYHYQEGLHKKDSLEGQKDDHMKTHTHPSLHCPFISLPPDITSSSLPVPTLLQRITCLLLLHSDFIDQPCCCLISSFCLLPPPATSLSPFPCIPLSLSPSPAPLSPHHFPHPPPSHCSHAHHWRCWHLQAGKWRRERKRSISWFCHHLLVTLGKQVGSWE